MKTLTENPRTVRFIIIIGVVAVGLSLALSVFSVTRVLSAPQLATITVPSTIGFEGFLVDESTGAPLDGTYAITFSVYSVAVGGSPIWTEELETVEVTDGLYAVELGAGTPFGTSTFDGARWIGVSVEGEAEMTPRTKVSSVPFALNAHTLDGKEVSDLEVPAGVIVMWSGSPSNVPDGWALCDGDGTPDLRGMFIVGYNASDTDYDAIGETGGAKTMAHTHQVDPPNTLSGEETSWRNTGSWSSHNKTGEGADHHRHYLNIPAFTSGEASNTENRPPYYVLAYIIKE